MGGLFCAVLGLRVGASLAHGMVLLYPYLGAFDLEELSGSWESGRGEFEGYLYLRAW